MYMYVSKQQQQPKINFQSRSDNVERILTRLASDFL